MSLLPPPPSSSDEELKKVFDIVATGENNTSDLPKAGRRNRRGRVILSDSSDEADFKKVPKKRFRKRKAKKTVKKKNLLFTSESDSDSGRSESNQQQPPRRITRSVAATNDVSESADLGFKTSASRKSTSSAKKSKTNPITDESPPAGSVTFRYKPHTTQAVLSHTTKAGKVMYRFVGHPNLEPRSGEAIVRGMERRYRHAPPQFARSPTPPVLSPESETDEDVEVAGTSFKLVKVGMSKQRTRGKFRRMYVTESCPQQQPRSRDAAINYIQNYLKSNEEVRSRPRITNLDPDDIINITVNGVSFELRYDRKASERSGMGLYRYKNGRKCLAIPAWRKQLLQWQRLSTERTTMVREWMTNQERPIPRQVMRRVTPFRINPRRIYLNSADAIADTENVAERNEHFNILDKAKDGRTGPRRRYLYFVVIIPDELVTHIQSDENGYCPEIYEWLRDHEDTASISLPLYVGRNSRAPEPSAYTFNTEMRSSIRREVKAGGRAFLIHVEEVNYPTRRAARAGIITLEAAAIAYLSFISPHTPNNSQVGKLKYCRANRHGEMDAFMDSHPRIQAHITAMASTTSRRPFHFLDDPYVPCLTDHSYPGQPYSAMLHPDRDMITEVILDKIEEEKSANEEESDLDLDGLSDNDDDVFEDISVSDSSAQQPTTLNSFTAALRFQQQSRGHNSCGMNAVNNFRQEGPLYTREFFQDIVANLEAEERNVIDTGELDEGAYGSERGDYSVDVLEQALVFAQYQTSRRFLDFNVDSSFGFIYNPGNHWIAVRRVQNQWVEFDSMATGPVVITQSEVIDLLNDYGNSMIIVTGESTA